MSRAASVGMPCCSVITWRTVPAEAGSGSPGFMFFTGTLRRTSRVWTISQTAPSLNASSAVRVSVPAFWSSSIVAGEPLKS